MNADNTMYTSKYITFIDKKNMELTITRLTINKVNLKKMKKWRKGQKDKIKIC